VILCPSCNTNHEPNEYSPYCRRSCKAFAERITKPQRQQPAPQSRIELYNVISGLQRDLVQARAAIVRLTSELNRRNRA
jgi:hypothetical protein